MGDVENNYHLLADLGLHALYTINCAKGKDFDQVFYKKEMKKLGFRLVSFLINFLRKSKYGQIPFYRMANNYSYY